MFGTRILEDGTNGVNPNNLIDMEPKFKMAKFHGDEGGFRQIRYKILPSKKIIAFGIAGTDLTTMQFGDGVDFDGESEKLLEEYHDSSTNMAFEYIPNVGFEEVKVTEQNWFKF